MCAASLATILEKRGKTDEAIAIYKDLYDLAHVAKNMSPRHAAMTAVPYGVTLAKAGRYAEAEAPLLEAKRMLDAAGMSDSSKLREVLEALVKVCDHTGKRDDAARWRAELARPR